MNIRSVPVGRYCLVDLGVSARWRSIKRLHFYV